MLRWTAVTLALAAAVALACEGRGGTPPPPDEPPVPGLPASMAAWATRSQPASAPA